MGKQASRKKLALSALDLFEQLGYDQTTVDMIAGQAGLSRTTFFRLFQTKEDVALINHEQLLNQIQVLFSNSTKDQAKATLMNAAFVILKGYLDDGELAIRRYRLSRSVPSLYVRELSSMHLYELAFRRFIKSSIFTEDTDTLRIELLASSVTTASNHVLRAWLRGSTIDPVGDFDEAMNRVLSKTATSERQSADNSSHAEYLVVRMNSEAGLSIKSLVQGSEWSRVVFEP